MKDRLPLYPGRVKLVPVSGQENVYDMTRADQPTQEGDPLNKATLLKDATAALFGLGPDSVPDDAFALLSKAALYKTELPFTFLGDISEGNIITLMEGGNPVEFYVAKHNYESELNGSGRTLVVRKDVHSKRKWSDTKIDTYATSDIDNWLNNNYKNLLDADVKNSISSTKFYYTPGGGDTNTKSISRDVFLLSAAEIGFSNEYVVGTKLPISNNLKIAYKDGAAITQWTRTVSNVSGETTNFLLYVESTGSINTLTAIGREGIRPVFTLPSTFHVKNTPSSKPGLYDVSNNLLLKLPGVQIATGSYVGTGKYGSSNPNSLTFEFEPKLVFIYKRRSKNNDYVMQLIFSPELGNFSDGYSYIDGGKRDEFTYMDSASWSKDKKTVSWYDQSDADTQANASGFTYHYIVFM